MYANAKAISRLAALTGDTAAAADYEARAQSLKTEMRRRALEYRLRSTSSIATGSPTRT